MAKKPGLCVACANEKIASLKEENARLTALLGSGTDEDKRDEWSERIDTAFPTRSGSHEEYATAMRMVSNRYSKASIVALVNWLLLLSREPI